MFASYGVSSAGLVLQHMLSQPENERYKRKIGCLIAELHETLDFLYGSPNRRMYEHIWIMLNKDIRARARGMELPTPIAEHLQSTITGILKQRRREFMINRGGLSKRQTEKLRQEYKEHYDRFQQKAKEL